MPRPDERERRRAREDTVAEPGAVDTPADESADPAASKTRKKAEMHALQDLGEALVALDARRFSELAAEVALDPRLVDAIVEARSISAWGGRKRQLQYVGKLMRGVDPEPIRHRLDEWAQGHAVDSARQHELEQWRDRLGDRRCGARSSGRPLASTRPAALSCADREGARRASRGQPPHAFRELFRELKALTRMQR
jgi:ribosome-associated protein